jgi:hypothetical protein
VKVEERPIKEYRLMLFTIFNAAALEAGMGGFQYMTDAEEYEEFDYMIEDYKKRGIFT